jgi:signal transduction histidine kinase
MRDLADPAPRREVRMTRWRLGLLAGASLLAPAVQVVQLLRDRHTEGLVTAVGSMVLFGLVLARLHGLAGEVAALAATRKQLLERTVQAREEERIRLAADLHDGPIQRLSGVAYTADLSRRRVTRGDLAGGQELLDSLEEDIRGEVAALRRVMVELRPPALDEWGLVAALGDHAATFHQQTGIACTVEAELPARLARAQETVLYRVAQEALVNVAKHARASQAWVSLQVVGDQVSLEIGDDGAGFVPGQAADPPGLGHFGLASMRQQVEMAGGVWQLRSRPGQGTTVTATLPRAGAGRAAGPPHRTGPFEPATGGRDGG